MERHFIALTYLEWLNWAARGVLRVNRERIIWAPADAEVHAFRVVMTAAPDLEPADDAFLLATMDRAPRLRFDGSSLDIFLAGVRFEALSERSRRLLEPTASRMEVRLEDASTALQRAWVQWKLDYRERSAEHRSQRLWTWGHGRSWPQDPASPEARTLSQTLEIEKKIIGLMQEEPEKSQWVSGTDAGPWFEIVLCAKQNGQLSAADTASWKEPINRYLKQAQRQAQMGPRFFRIDDAGFTAAIAEFAFQRRDVAQLLAYAIGRHHSSRMSLGLAPDLAAFREDLKDYANYYCCDGEDDLRRRGLDVALLAWARALPDEAIARLVANSSLQFGWIEALLDAGLIDSLSADISSENSSVEVHRSPRVETPHLWLEEQKSHQPQIASQDDAEAPELLPVDAGVPDGTDGSLASAAPPPPRSSSTKRSRKLPSEKKNGGGKDKAPSSPSLL